MPSRLLFISARNAPKNIFHFFESILTGGRELVL